VEPESGFAMAKFDTTQVSLKYPAMQHFYNITGPGYAPIFWQDDYEEISESDAQQFLSLVNFAKRSSISCLVVGIIGGIAFIGAGIYIVVRWYRHKDEVGQIELELFDVDESFKKSSTNLNKQGSSTKLFL